MDFGATNNRTSALVIDELFVHLDSPTFPTLVAIENSIPKVPFLQTCFHYHIFLQEEHEEYNHRSTIASPTW